MMCLVDAVAAMFAAKPETQRQSSDASQEKRSDPRQEEIDNLIRLREKSWEETMACVDQPNVLFVALTIRAAKEHPMDVVELPFIHAGYIESEMFYECRSSKRLRASIGNNRAAIEKFKQFRNKSSKYGCSKEYIRADKREETVIQFLQKVKEAYPGRRLILVGHDLRRVLHTFEHVCPEAATYFADVIDLGWLYWFTRPEAGHLGHMCLKGEAPRYDTYDPEEDNSIFGCPFDWLRRYFDLPENEAPHRLRIGPDLVVKPEPDAPFAAKIYSKNRSRLPDDISSTVNLARYIKRLGHKPVRVGTWGWPPLCCKPALDIYGIRGLYGWVCFEDLVSLEAFISQVDGTVVGTKTMKVGSWHTNRKPASLMNTQVSHENQQETLSFEETEVEETKPRTEKFDGSGEESRLIEPLDLGEDMDTGDFMNFAMSLCNSS